MRCHTESYWVEGLAVADCFRQHLRTAGREKVLQPTGNGSHWTGSKCWSPHWNIGYHWGPMVSGSTLKPLKSFSVVMSIWANGPGIPDPLLEWPRCQGFAAWRWQLPPGWRRSCCCAVVLQPLGVSAPSPGAVASPDMRIHPIFHWASSWGRLGSVGIVFRILNFHRSVAYDQNSPPGTHPPTRGRLCC